MVAGPIVAASILNRARVTPTGSAKPCIPWFSMAQRPTINPSADAEVAPGAETEVDRPSAELPMERSRFSRWLARFGLGELTDPILRPTKPSAGQAPNG
jgi:hypothetical protein